MDYLWRICSVFKNFRTLFGKIHSKQIKETFLFQIIFVCLLWSFSQKKVGKFRKLNKFIPGGPLFSSHTVHKSFFSCLFKRKLKKKKEVPIFWMFCRTLRSTDVSPPFQLLNFYGSRLDLTFFLCFSFLRLNHLSSIVVGFLPQTSGSFPIYFLVRTIFWRWRRRLVRWRNCNILKYSYFDSFLGYHFWDTIFGVPFFMEKPRKNSQLLSFRQ